MGCGSSVRRGGRHYYEQEKNSKVVGDWLWTQNEIKDLLFI